MPWVPKWHLFSAFLHSFCISLTVYDVCAYMQHMIIYQIYIYTHPPFRCMFIFWRLYFNPWSYSRWPWPSSNFHFATNATRNHEQAQTWEKNKHGNYPRWGQMTQSCGIIDKIMPRKLKRLLLEWFSMLFWRFFLVFDVFLLF